MTDLVMEYPRPKAGEIVVAVAAGVVGAATAAIFVIATLLL
jgi:hypothetical protein